MTTDWRDQTQTTRDGHLLWTGLTHHSLPVLTNSVHRSVRRVAYNEHYGRAPVGAVLTTCDHQLCLYGDHLGDSEDRQRAYEAVAEQRGFPTWSGYCHFGHAWADTAMFMTDGRRRCTSCMHGDPPVDHSVSIELTVSGRPEQLPRRDQIEAARLLICRRGLSHNRVAQLIGRSPRTVTRWAVKNEWRKPVGTR